MLRKGLYYLTHWEVWHWFVKYIFIGPAWAWYCCKSRSLWFFTSSNPAITFGGFLGETKREIYQHLPPGSYPKSIFVSPRDNCMDIKSQVDSNGIRFPFVVKPDVGMMGLMFRKIESFDQLRQYHAVMKSDYIVQEYADYPLEVSVFYYRLPGESKGHITGFVKKEYMTVTGDGKSTLKELILQYPRARFRTKELFGKHESRLNEVVENKKVFVLSDALNLSRGGLLVSLEHEKDEQLLSVFDNLSNYSKNFFYGRYDIKCASVADLKEGKNFTILEYNGCGGEPHHVYGNNNSFFRACFILIDHFRILYEISNRNRANGQQPWGLWPGAVFLQSSKAYFRELKALDHSFSFKKETGKNISRTIFPTIPSLGQPAINIKQRVA
ncbi:MAG TPA: hypothetical protein VK508_02255 [Cyclobacteriaceae bacterium]|nr:hypothetical protein [Cyclobacteriaceae bacterium]